MSLSTKGHFITIEGSDGVGKSTQIANIENFFKRLDYEVIITREPGGTNIGEKLRTILLDADNKEMDSVTEMLIYAASRAQHVKEVIEPGVNRGCIVISDRFTDSSIAYQGYGRGLGDSVKIVNNYATYGIEPDLTFWLDLDPRIGRKRIELGRKSSDGEEVLDRIELEKLDFHDKVRMGYEASYELNPDRVKKIDASVSSEEVWAQIKDCLDAYIEK